MRFIMLDLFFGMAWTFILIHPIGADEQSGTFMLFVMLSGVRSMLATNANEIRGFLAVQRPKSSQKSMPGSLWEA